MSAGIPTLYRGMRFRSRLEAKWAVFFDRLGWRWTYEPFDLRGYIPDFVLHMHKPLLVEVKPDIDAASLRTHVDKIDASGWADEALVVGVRPIDFKTYRFAGLLRDQGDWKEGVIFICKQCKGWSLCHTHGSFACRACGAGDGHDVRHHWVHGIRDGRVAQGIDSHWASASNAVQWRGAPS